MFRLCIREYQRGIRRNLLISILLAASIVLVLLTIGNMKTTYRYYEGLEPYLGEYGVLLTEASGSDKVGLSEYLDGIEGIKNYKFYGSTLMEFCFEGDESFRKVFLYDSEDASRVMPDLIEGAWVESRPDDKRIVHVLVSENEDDIQVGDILESKYSRNDGNLIDVKVKVVGKIRNGERIAGNLQYESDLNLISYESFYSPFDLEQNEECIFVSTEEEFSKLENMFVPNSAFGLLQYEEDLTKEEIKELQRQVRQYFIDREVTVIDIGTWKLSVVYENSKRIIRTLVAKFLPFAIATLVISLICILASSAVSTLEGLYHYTVYYLTGMKWNGIVKVSGFIAGVNDGVAIVLSGATILIMKRKVPGIAGRIWIDYGQVGLIIGLLVLAVLLAMVMPLMIMRGNRPAKLLRNMKV